MQRRLATAADAEVLRHLYLYPSQHEIIFLTPTDHALFVKAVTPLVDEQRQVLGHEVLRYVRYSALNGEACRWHPASRLREATDEDPQL